MTQLLLYTEEYRRGTFAVGGATTAVRDVAGREPEDFETIARRVVAQSPEAVRTMGNKVRAAANFMKIAATPKPDPERIEAQRGHVLIKSPAFAQDSREWRRHHDPRAGFVPDGGADLQAVPIRAAG